MRLLGNRRSRYLPEGIIVFYNGGSAPTGWTAHSTGDDRMLVAAGTSYAPGTTGGTIYPTVSYSGTMGNGAAHTLSASDDIPHDPLGDPQTAYDGSAGSHTHDYDTAVHIPAQDTLKLIKLQSITKEFPVNTVVLGGDSFSGLSIINNNDKYLGIASTPGSVTKSQYLSITSGS